MPEENLTESNPHSDTAYCENDTQTPCFYLEISNRTKQHRYTVGLTTDIPVPDYALKEGGGGSYKMSSVLPLSHCFRKLSPGSALLVV